jgi:hypothetical protein
MDFIQDPLWWWFLLISSLCLSVYGGLGLESFLRGKKTASLVKLDPLKYACLFSWVMILLVLFRLFGFIAAALNLLGSSTLCVAFMTTLLDRNAILSAQAKRIVQRKRVRDIDKRMCTQKLLGNEHLMTLIQAFSIEEKDLDDYFELLAGEWPRQDLLGVLEAPEVFEYYFKTQHSSKWEVLKTIRNIVQNRSLGPGEPPGPAKSGVR